MDGSVPLIYLGLVLSIFVSGILILYCILIFIAKHGKLRISKYLYATIRANLIFNIILLPVVLLAARTIIGYGPLPYVFYTVLAISTLIFFVAKSRYEESNRL